MAKQQLMHHSFAYHGFHAELRQIHFVRRSSHDHTCDTTHADKLTINQVAKWQLSSKPQAAAP